MKRMIIAASALALMSGVAMAQTAPSSADKPGAAGQQPTTDPKQTSPGATGAMQNESGGVATSPQDVQKQGGAATAPSHKDQGSSSTGGASKPQ
ncbi:hypothetical protein IHQ68_13520 [Chelatococcus sambhunathii]|uniref:Uncharacterized protein n=1 Tax=Chelatococcus sambhunathii TaxID=363953 RepID=A0ABU1DHN8_9HYPH|nr:hypothetical protein [Chelatococcus sambhunathii]MDR4307638.1 hypothetical protein [Chelatococcus sambhunathii]